MIDRERCQSLNIALVEHIDFSPAQKKQISTAPNHQAWRTSRVRVLFSPIHAEIFHQNVRLPDERARLGTGCALAYGARVRAGLKRVRS